MPEFAAPKGVPDYVPPDSAQFVAVRSALLDAALPLYGTGPDDVWSLVARAKTLRTAAILLDQANGAFDRAVRDAYAKLCKEAGGADVAVAVNPFESTPPTVTVSVCDAPALPVNGPVKLHGALFAPGARVTPIKLPHVLPGSVARFP